MGNIERCWIWTTRHEASGQVQRGVMFHKPEASRNYVEVAEFVPAEQLRRAVVALRAVLAIGEADAEPEVQIFDIVDVASDALNRLGGQ